MHQHWIWMRENGSSLNFNSLLNPAEDEDWVCQHRLMQFFLEKIMRWTMFRSIQTFSVNGIFTERYHIFCAWTDLLFTIFVSSRYRPWAPIRLLHHYGFVMFVNSRACCTHFSCHCRKIRKICGWCKSLKGSMPPRFLFCPQKLSLYGYWP